MLRELFTCLLRILDHPGLCRDDLPSSNFRYFAFYSCHAYDMGDNSVKYNASKKMVKISKKTTTTGLSQAQGIDQVRTLE